MQSNLFKILTVMVFIFLVVWLLVGKPDRAAELNTLKQELASEADLHSQALTFAMAKYRQASVLLAQTDFVASIVRGEVEQIDLDHLFYLQAVSGVSSIHIISKQNTAGMPIVSLPHEAPALELWNQGVARAFQGALGRAFYTNSSGRPIYVFFTPVPRTVPGVNEILIVKIDMGLIRDSWQVSRNRIELQSKDGTPWLDNDIQSPAHPVFIERAHTPSGSVLKISATPPALFGQWTLRSLILSLLFLLIGVLTFSLMERRRFLAQLAEQQATEAQRLEHEVAVRTKELEKVQKRLGLSEKLALLGQMSASISHEINQPLAAIKNYAVSAQRQIERNETARLPANLKNIEQLCDRVARIVVNLRGFAGSDSSPVKVINIAEIATEALKEFHDRFPAAEQYTKGTSDPGTHTALAGRIRLLQVLANLLTNAWHACNKQPSPLISITTRRLPEHVEILIEDNGPGIDTKLSTQIFDAFVTKRAHSTDLGLGLTISKSFIESMDGDLRIAYSGPEGTGFLITLKSA